MFGRFIALGAIRLESLCRKRSTWVLLPAPDFAVQKSHPFQSDIRKSFANCSEREFERWGGKPGWETGVGWVWIWSGLWAGAGSALQTLGRRGRVVELSSPATSSRVQSATSRGRGGRCRQGEDFFSPLAKKSEKLSQFLKTVCREWDGGWKIEMCHIKGVLKRWQLVPEPWTWQLKQLLG